MVWGCSTFVADMATATAIAAANARRDTRRGVAVKLAAGSDGQDSGARDAMLCNLGSPNPPGVRTSPDYSIDAYRPCSVSEPRDFA
jgi:hypothetical protein